MKRIFALLAITSVLFASCNTKNIHTYNGERDIISLEPHEYHIIVCDNESYDSVFDKHSTAYHERLWNLQSGLSNCKSASWSAPYIVKPTYYNLIDRYERMIADLKSNHIHIKKSGSDNYIAFGNTESRTLYVRDRWIDKVRLKRYLDSQGCPYVVEKQVKITIRTLHSPQPTKTHIELPPIGIVIFCLIVLVIAVSMGLYLKRRIDGYDDDPKEE